MSLPDLIIEIVDVIQNNKQRPKYSPYQAEMKYANNYYKTVEPVCLKIFGHTLFN